MRGACSGKKAQPHSVAQLLAGCPGRLAEIGGVYGNLMAAAHERAGHLEARLGRAAAGGRQIADDMKDAQSPIALAVVGGRLRL